MKWLATFILFITFHSAIGQVLNRQYIETWVAKFNPKTKGQPITMYVVDGQYFYVDMPGKRDSILRQLDSTLHKISRQDVAFIYGISTDEVSFAEVPGKVMVMVATKGKERKKEKKRELKRAIAKYDSSEIYLDHLSKDSKDPVLFINDKEIYFSQCRKELMKIKKSSIYAIAIYNQPVPTEYYGENAKNGLIEIWTYPVKK
jgi:hypothetical protein